MTTEQIDVSAAVEGTDYEVDINSHREINISKIHDDGRVTQVNIERRFGDNTLDAIDTKGTQELGYIRLGDHDQLSDAVESAAEWIQANPEGVNAGVN